MKSTFETCATLPAASRVACEKEAQGILEDMYEKCEESDSDPEPPTCA
jgi:hypothetical protein